MGGGAEFLIFTIRRYLGYLVIISWPSQESGCIILFKKREKIPYIPYCECILVTHTISTPYLTYYGEKI